MIQTIQDSQDIQDSQLSQEVINQSFDINIAYTLCKFSANAYENADTLKTIYSDTPWDFDESNFFEDQYTSTQGFIVSNRSRDALGRKINSIVVAFRGSENLSGILSPYSDGWIDWIQTDGNLKLTSWSSSTPHIKVATGFKGAWDNIKAQVISKISKLITNLGSADEVNLYITGHSLGAALATLATVELYQTFTEVNLVTYTYATPVVGNRDFAQMYNELVAKSSDKAIKSEHFLIEIDPIRLVGYFKGCSDNDNSGNCYVAVNKQNILPSLLTINPHSILNYVYLLSPSTNTPAESQEFDSIVPLQSSFSPLYQPTSVLAETPTTQIVLRTYTSQGFDTNSLYDRVYFYTDVREDGTGGKEFILKKSNHSQPFQSGYIDTFELSSADDLTFGDFTRCKLEKEKNPTGNKKWGLQGLQILLDGRELFNNPGIFTQFNNQNRVFYFSGIDPNKVAVGIKWKYNEGISYDKSGVDPVCSMDSFGNVVEVHKGKNSDKLYYRRGKMNEDGSMTWDQSSHEYDKSGATPWVAINDQNFVIEVHKGAKNDNKFYYRVGYLSDGFKIDWEDSREYDTSGLNPSVAIRGKQIVEVHKGKNSNKLYYRLGVLDDRRKRVEWGDSHDYDSSGKNPSVTITADLRVVEVHQGANSDKLYYRVGHIFNSPFIFNSTITWDINSHEYDTSGDKPTIAVDRYGKVLEVHKGANSDKLYYRVGTMGNDFTVVWASSSQQYDSSGKAPVVAINNRGQVIEVHKGANSNKLHYRAGKWVKNPFNII